MVQASIVEPAKVTRQPTRNAASTAALFLIIEVVIGDHPA